MPTGAGYFGYAWGDPTTTDMDAVKAHSNIYTVVAYDPTVSLLSIVNLCAARSMLALIAIGPIVADATTGARRTDWSTRLTTFKNNNTWLNGSDGSKAVGIYLPDEMYHCGWTGTQVNDVCSALNTHFSGHAHAMVEAHQEVRIYSGGTLDLANSLFGTNKPVPSTVAWIGFDRYGVLPVSDTDFQADFAHIKAKKSSAQKVLLVGEAQWIQDYIDAGYQPTVMKDIIESYRTVAYDAEVAAVLVYCYPNDFEYSGYKAYEWLAANYSTVKTAHVTAGKSITGKP